MVWNRAPKPSSWIVKKRKVSWKYGAWEIVAYCSTCSGACERAARVAGAGKAYDVAIFFRGKRSKDGPAVTQTWRR